MYIPILLKKTDIEKYKGKKIMVYICDSMLFNLVRT